jgi:phosphate transport system permease protein
VDIRKLKDSLARRAMFLICASVVSLAFFMALILFTRATPVFESAGVKDILFSGFWHPAQGRFGLANFITGTFLVTGIAIIIAVPLGMLTAIYLAEYADRRVRNIIKPVIDLLAGISPIIYGVWGVIVIVPLVRDYIMPFVSETFPFFPFASDNYTGFSALSAGIVLSVMVFPIIISVAEEVMRTVPEGLREVSLSLGATKWQTIKHAVVKKAWPGIIAAIILGLSRALGETMAVLMVAGSALNVIPASIFDTAYPLPAFIANTYGELMSIPLYDSAVFLAAFVLLALTAAFNMLGWGILLKLEKGGA